MLKLKEIMTWKIIVIFAILKELSLIRKDKVLFIIYKKNTIYGIMFTISITFSKKTKQS